MTVCAAQRSIQRTPPHLQHNEDDDEEAHTIKLKAEHGSRLTTDTNDIQLDGTIKSGGGGDATITTATTVAINEDIDAVSDITKLGSTAKSSGGNSNKNHIRD